MISEERLQELIDENATIWADCYGEIQLCDKSEVCRVISCEGESYCLSGFICDGEFLPFAVIPEEMEENVEKGNWEYEMHASRLERFDPPVWEEINDDTNWECFFFTRDGYDYYFVVDGLMESISLRSEYGKKYYFDFTKEDYIKACTIARKLFLGESVEKGENNEESKN